MASKNSTRWTRIRISAADVERQKERRLHREYSLHLECDGHPDRAIIYWHADEDGGRVYFFSPEAATIAGELLAPFSPVVVLKPAMRDLRQLGAAVANWRHSYVNLH
jgi:hypothetical protein